MSDKTRKDFDAWLATRIDDYKCGNLRPWEVWQAATARSEADHQVEKIESEIDKLGSGYFHAQDKRLLVDACEAIRAALNERKK